MSKLANAPLLEVIFELRWHIKDQTELNQHQYLHGDLYNCLKNKYPFRESIAIFGLPSDTLVAGMVTHRFRTKENEYPLLQVGNGVITVNTTDATYDWEDYKERCVEATSKLFEVFQQINQKDGIDLTLQYQDFLPYNTDSTNLYEYLKENLHINLKQTFYTNTEKPRGLAISFQYDTPHGILEVVINQAKNQTTNQIGLLITFKVVSIQRKPDANLIIQWLEDAHKITDKTFKKMMAGKIMTSFQ